MLKSNKTSLLKSQFFIVPDIHRWDNSAFLKSFMEGTLIKLCYEKCFFLILKIKV